MIVHSYTSSCHLIDNMRQITSFFELVKKKLDEAGLVNDHIHQVIKEVCEVNKEEYVLKKRDTTLYITAHPMIKNQIVLRKDILLNIYTERNIKITDIR